MKPFRHFALSPFLRVLFALSPFLLFSCSESSTHPHDDDDHDFITTIKLFVKDSATNESVVFVWEDIDGPGGAAPSRIDTVVLGAGRAYVTEVIVMNSSVSPVEDLTSTIVTEGDQHQFFYTVDQADLALLYLDKDKNNKPIGQQLKMNAGTVGGGTLTVELSHYDKASDKNGVDPSDETDISVVFPVSIR